MFMIHRTSGRSGYTPTEEKTIRTTIADTDTLEIPDVPMMLHITSGRSGHRTLSDKPPKDCTHDGIVCDNCDAINIRGVRYKCLCCPNYDLCALCIEINENPNTNFHSREHLFIRLKNTSRGAKDEDVPQLITNRASLVHNENCVNCKLQIVGVRYFCTTCAFNMCEACELNSKKFHDRSHNLLKMQPPASLTPPLPPPPVALSVSEDVLLHVVVFTTNNCDDLTGSDPRWRQASASMMSRAIEDATKYELVCAMLGRESRLRLSDSVNACILAQGSDAYGGIMDRVQRQVGTEFGFSGAGVETALGLLRCCESMYATQPERLAHVRELSYYRKFNRCKAGSVSLGEAPPALHLLHRFEAALSAVDILNEYYFDLQPRIPLVLLAGSYS